MKFYLFLFIFAVGFIACKSSSQKENTTQTTSTETAKKVIHRVDNATFAQQMTNSPEAQLIDVRTPEEYKEGRIENAVNINYYDDDFAQQAISKLDKNKPVLVYCARGGRSAKAAKVLKKQGFTEIYDLKTGYTGWGEK